MPSESGVGAGWRWLAWLQCRRLHLASSSRHNCLQAARSYNSSRAKQTGNACTSATTIWVCRGRQACFIVSSPCETAPPVALGDTPSRFFSVPEKFEVYVRIPGIPQVRLSSCTWYVLHVPVLYYFYHAASTRPRQFLKIVRKTWPQFLKARQASKSHC